MSGHDELRDAAGAWVLGALDEDDAWHFAAHLEVCATCRTEVTRLQIAADVLPLAAPPLDPPPELRERLMAIVEAEARERSEEEPASIRRRASRRWRLPQLVPRTALAAAAACALIVGGLAGFALRGGHGSTTQTVQASVDRGVAGGARAELLQTGDHAVLRVSNMRPPAAGRVYQVWVAHPGARPVQPDAVFTVDRHGRGSVAILGQIRGTSEIMVTSEPSGGSPKPTGPRILVARPA